MINELSRTAVENAQLPHGFQKPLYGSHCFSGIPGTIESLLTGVITRVLPPDVLGAYADGCKKIIFLYLDAFGWELFEHVKDEYAFLKRALSEGRVSQLTSQFPSTTAAHTACIHTGLEPGESGIYEWYLYEPDVDAVIAPILHSYAGDKRREILLEAGIPAERLYRHSTVYERLSGHGVASYVCMFEGYVESSYSRSMTRGSAIVPYRDLKQSFGLLRDVVRGEEGPAYFFHYWDGVDVAGHHQGLFSPGHLDEVSRYFVALDALCRELQGSSDTLILLSTDHGQVAISPEDTVYIESDLPLILDASVTSANGNIVGPAGSSRDLFLHIKEERISEVVAYLRDRLASRADVREVKELMSSGFFGTEKPGKRFRDRVGNVVILPYAGQSVWWHKEGAFSQCFLAHHGGLTREEMVIPFIALRP